MRWLALAGLLTLGSGWLLGYLGVCPVVKRIWTPSWTLYSGGCCFLMLAAAYAIMDILQRRVWAFPLVVIGMNSIAAYCIAELFEGFIRDALRRHLPSSFFRAFGPAYEPLLLGTCILAVLWLILLAIYRRKVFLRI